MPLDAAGEIASTLVLVSGVPGAGKTTLGRALARALDAPFLSLDEIKERLYVASTVALDDRELRYAAEAELAAELAGDGGTVVVDIWIAPHRDTGRITALLSRQQRRVVEVLCRVPADLAVERYSRRKRPGPHRAADAATVQRIRDAAGQIAPLGLGHCVEVETSRPVDIADLVQRLARLARRATA